MSLTEVTINSLAQGFLLPQCIRHDLLLHLRVLGGDRDSVQAPDEYVSRTPHTTATVVPRFHVIAAAAIPVCLPVSLFSALGRGHGMPYTLGLGKKGGRPNSLALPGMTSCMAWKAGGVGRRFGLNFKAGERLHTAGRVGGWAVP